MWCQLWLLWNLHYVCWGLITPATSWRSCWQRVLWYTVFSYWCFSHSSSFCSSSVSHTISSCREMEKTVILWMSNKTNLHKDLKGLPVSKKHCSHAGHRETCSSHTQQHLPSPCAACSPLPPSYSQTEPQWWWWRRLVDCSAAPLVPLSDTPETHSPPQNNDPKEQRDRSKWASCQTGWVYRFKTSSFPLTSSINLARRSLSAAMMIRSWANWFRPSLLSALAATKSSLSQSHSSVATFLREGHNVPRTGKRIFQKIWPMFYNFC